MTHRTFVFLSFALSLASAGIAAAEPVTLNCHGKALTGHTPGAPISFRVDVDPTSQRVLTVGRAHVTETTGYTDRQLTFRIDYRSAKGAFAAIYVIDRPDGAFSLREGVTTGQRNIAVGRELETFAGNCDGIMGLLMLPTAPETPAIDPASPVTAPLPQ
ncbi:MAG: hypothetical protein P4M00_03375 [Azospirillaceae bacterium]|nr:hypothetical protein [Azospirillaceae bacterium]